MPVTWPRPGFNPRINTAAGSTGSGSCDRTSQVLSQSIYFEDDESECSQPRANSLPSSVTDVFSDELEQFFHSMESEKTSMDAIQACKKCRCCNVSDQKCSSETCVRVVLISVIIVLIAWGILAPWYLIVGPGSIKPGSKCEIIEDDSNIRLFSNRTIPQGAALNVLNSSLEVINGTFLPEYANRSSEAFIEFKSLLENELLLHYQRRPQHDIKLIVINKMKRLSPDGIFLVNFLLVFPSAQSINALDAILEDHLGQGNVELTSYQIKYSSQVEYAVNICNLQNGGCDQICHWAVEYSEEVTCRCHKYYQLQTDERKCKPIPLNTSSTTEVPKSCDASMYTCKETSTCIPHVWLCDRQLDCIGGDDEDNC